MHPSSNTHGNTQTVIKSSVLTLWAQHAWFLGKHDTAAVKRNNDVLHLPQHLRWPGKLLWCWASSLPALPFPWTPGNKHSHSRGQTGDKNKPQQGSDRWQKQATAGVRQVTKTISSFNKTNTTGTQSWLRGLITNTTGTQSWLRGLITDR